MQLKAFTFTKRLTNWNKLRPLPFNASNDKDYDDWNKKWNHKKNAKISERKLMKLNKLFLYNSQAQFNFYVVFAEFKEKVGAEKHINDADDDDGLTKIIYLKKK